MGNRDVAEQLEAAIEEVGKLEREVAELKSQDEGRRSRIRELLLEVDRLRAEKDSPHADAKYWRELREARAKLAESRDCNAGIAANFSRYYNAWERVKAERDAALAVIADAAAWIPEEPTFESHESKERALRSVRSALAKSPTDALAEHDREVKAEALEEAAAVVHVDMSISADDRPVGWANRLRARAAEIRKAT